MTESNSMEDMMRALDKLPSPSSDWKARAIKAEDRVKKLEIALRRLVGHSRGVDGYVSEYPTDNLEDEATIYRWRVAIELAEDANTASADTHVSLPAARDLALQAVADAEQRRRESAEREAAEDSGDNGKDGGA